MVFDTVHISTSIDRAAHDVYIYASNPRNLSAWARGLAHRDVEFVDDVWVIDSPLGSSHCRVRPSEPVRHLDHNFFKDTPGVVTFTLDATGTVTGGTLVQDGETLLATKVG